MIVIDRYIDNRREIEIEKALEELERQALNEEAQAAEWRANIGNPSALYGAI